MGPGVKPAPPVSLSTAECKVQVENGQLITRALVVPVAGGSTIRATWNDVEIGSSVRGQIAVSTETPFPPGVAGTAVVYLDNQKMGEVAVVKQLVPFTLDTSAWRYRRGRVSWVFHATSARVDFCLQSATFR